VENKLKLDDICRLSKLVVFCFILDLVIKSFKYNFAPTLCRELQVLYNEYGPINTTEHLSEEAIEKLKVYEEKNEEKNEEKSEDNFEERFGENNNYENNMKNEKRKKKLSIKEHEFIEVENIID